jgi:hypothetical protein
MYGVAGAMRPIFSESYAFLYNLGDPIYSGLVFGEYVTDLSFAIILGLLPI